jgi:hypothetical protein
VELGSAGGAWLLCGLVFLAVPAMRKRRHDRGIISPRFYLSPMEIYSDVNGEAGETCPGVDDASSSFPGDDVVDPVNHKEDALRENLHPHLLLLLNSPFARRSI